MNDADEKIAELEARLRRLRPASVPPELMARLRAAAPASAPAPARAARFPRLWAAAAAALVACAGLFSWVRGPRPAPPPGAAAAAVAELEAESPREVLVGARQAGIWTAPDGRLYRVVQCLSMSRTVLHEPGKGAQVDVLEPRPRVVLLAMGSQ